jgi:hypothetical protein
MKKMFYILALVALGATSSFAQQRVFEGRKDKVINIKTQISPEERANRRVAQLEKKLNLNADQKVKIKQIELDRIKKQEEWRKEDRAIAQKRLESRKVFFNASKNKVNNVLTAEQKKIYETATRPNKFRAAKFKKDSLERRKFQQFKQKREFKKDSLQRRMPKQR